MLQISSELEFTTNFYKTALKYQLFEASKFTTSKIDFFFGKYQFMWCLSIGLGFCLSILFFLSKSIFLTYFISIIWKKYWQRKCNDFKIFITTSYYGGLTVRSCSTRTGSEQLQSQVTKGCTLPKAKTALPH